MTGHDIRNAMMGAYGLDPGPDPYDLETLGIPEGLARLQRFLIVLMMAMKGGM